MAIAFVASALQFALSESVLNLTVPAGVTGQHLGIIVVTTAEDVPVVGWTINEWVERLENPAGQGAMGFGLFTRLGGHTEGDIIKVESDFPRPTSISGVWYNTNGRGISVVGAPGVRDGVTTGILTIPGITTTTDGQDIIIVSTERSASAPSTINPWSPSAPAYNHYVEFSATTQTTHFVGSLVKSTPGPTGNYVPTYVTPSPNAVGVMLSVTPPMVGWIKDPSATGGKRSITHHRNPSPNEAIDGGTPGETSFTDGEIDGGDPGTTEFFSREIDGGEVSG